MPGTFEIEEDLDFQRKVWTFQRIGLLVLIAGLIAAALGFLGEAGLSRRTARSEGLAVEYEKYDRFDSSSRITVVVAPRLHGTRRLAIWLGEDLARAIQIQRITPQPIEIRQAPGALVAVFGVTDPNARLSLLIDYRPQSVGWISGQFGVSGESRRVSFSTLVYP